MSKNNFIGEFIGTFVMVFFGLGTVAVAVLFNALPGQLQIAFCWGVCITLAIYMTRNLCCAHFNPAVTIAMVVTGRMKASKMPVYILAQFLGAFFGALVIYLMFAPSIEAFEVANGITRGTFDSVATAKMFGEYYNQPGSTAVVSLGLAAMVEGIATFVLVFVIFCLTESCNVGRPDNNMAPVYIGFTVTILQCITAALTQCGMNPARDFAPRLVALIFGWGAWAFPDASGGAFFVYILAPIVGGILAGILFTKVIEPGMNKENCGCGC